MKFFVALAFVALCSATQYTVPLVSQFSYATYSADPVSATYSSIGQITPVIHNFVPTPITYSAPFTTIVSPAVLEKTQYHSQDTLGQATYGHSEAFQTHNAVQDISGNKIGSYSYVAPDGRVLTTSYVADALGYRVTTNALPVAPVVPEVTVPVRTDAVVPVATEIVSEQQVPEQPATEQVESAEENKEEINSENDDSTVIESLPQVPQDTPEVIAARSAHLAEYEAVKARSKRALF